MQGARAIAAAAALIGAFAGPAAAGGLDGPDSSRPYWAQPPALTLRSIPVSPVTPRPEVRSHRPYSGLQFGFRPEPPGERGIRLVPDDARPDVVMPEAVPPLVEYGPPPASAGPSYSYCSERARCPLRGLAPLSESPLPAFSG